MLIKHSGIKHKCPQCEYTHYYPNRVKSHENQIHKKIRRITGKKRMLCNDNTCSQFGSNECKEIELHGRHKCAECDFASRLLQDLNRHLERMHEGAIYRCEKCQYCSKTKNDLIIHLHSKHSNNGKELKLHGRQKCAECDFVAKRSNDLSKHVRSVHEGVVYHCEECQYYSKSKYDLKIHVQSKRDGIVFSCDHCELSPLNKRQLRYHINTAHKSVLQCEISGIQRS